MLGFDSCGCWVLWGFSNFVRGWVVVVVVVVVVGGFGFCGYVRCF